MHRRTVHVRHGTAMPLHLFGRTAELAVLDGALAGAASVIAFVGPGRQGKPRAAIG